MNEELVARLQARSASLTGRVLEQMYRDPFWQARFGERGRQFAQQDGEFHLAYLTQSLTAGSPQTMVNYARWLQSVLTTRGMCTLHIDENFDRLSTAIAEEVEWAAVACEHLERARRALRYDSGPARDLQDSAAAMLERMLRATDGEARDQWRLLLSYLADAVALRRPEVLAGHASWLVQANPGLSSGGAVALFDALGQAIDESTELSDSSRDDAQRVLQASRELVAAGPSRADAAVTP